MPNGCMNAIKMDNRTTGSTIVSSTTNLKTLKGLFEEPSKCNDTSQFIRAFTSHYYYPDYYNANKY